MNLSNLSIAYVPCTTFKKIIPHITVVNPQSFMSREVQQCLRTLPISQVDYIKNLRHRSLEHLFIDFISTTSKVQHKYDYFMLLFDSSILPLIHHNVQSECPNEWALQPRIPADTTFILQTNETIDSVEPVATIPRLKSFMNGSRFLVCSKKLLQSVRNAIDRRSRKWYKPLVSFDEWFYNHIIRAKGCYFLNPESMRTTCQLSLKLQPTSHNIHCEPSYQRWCSQLTNLVRQGLQINEPVQLAGCHFEQQKILSRINSIDYLTSQFNCMEIHV